MRSPTIARVSRRRIEQASEAWFQDQSGSDLDDPAAVLARARALRTGLDAMTRAFARVEPRERRCEREGRVGSRRVAGERASGPLGPDVVVVPDFTAVDTAYRVQLRTYAIQRDPALGARGSRIQLTSARQVHALAREIFGRLDADQEHFAIILCDAACEVLGFKVIASGAREYVDVDPALVLRSALLLGAQDIVAIHNHPSGDPTPSPLDLELTRRLILAGQIVNVPLLDHLVYTDRGSVSIQMQHRALFEQDASPLWERFGS